MTLTVKERRELCSNTMQQLTEVIGASGKAEELVKLTTQIVQAAKKLVEGTPEPMKNRSTAMLAEFVMAAKKIAQDTRAVDSTSLQRLSTARKAVEGLVKELDDWHTSQAPKDDTDISLEEILSQTSSGMTRSESRTSVGGVSLSRQQQQQRQSGSSLVGMGSSSRLSSSPTEPAVTEQERKLLAELKKQQEELLKKSEPQSKPEHHGDPENTLKITVTGLSRSTSQLVDLAGQKSPSREALLEPTVVMVRMVCILLDLVDTLFVSKYPMRSQVRCVGQWTSKDVIALCVVHYCVDVSKVSLWATT